MGRDRRDHRERDHGDARGEEGAGGRGGIRKLGERMLVTTEELAKHLDDPDWIVVDTRHELTNPETGPKKYAEGHIPGAYFLHTDYDLSGPKTGKNGRHPLPDIAKF